MAETRTQPPAMNSFMKAAMNAQVWMLRRGLMGSLGDQIMVITVTGRKSGRQYSTPIGFLRDGETIIALSRGSNWFKNAVATGNARVEIKGVTTQVSVEPVKDQAERERIFNSYKQRRANTFPRLFGVPADASEADLKSALATRDFVKLHPVN
jgi:deazaflavin-dependent oxidoreductase (nitroreductase family)